MQDEEDLKPFDELEEFPEFDNLTTPKEVLLSKNEIKNVKSIHIHCKCVDNDFSAELLNSDEKVLAESNGHVPRFFPDEPCGEDVSLNIDIKTGRILNWKVPTDEELLKEFGDEC
jgi:hypothetical protein